MIRGLLANQKDKNKTFIIEKDRELSYTELIRRAGAFQSALGHRQNQSVAVLLPNGGDYVSAVWGVISLGLTVFPLNVLMTRRELMSLLEQADIKTLISSTEFRRLLEEPDGKMNALEIIYADELEPGDESLAVIDANPNEPMVMLSTSGTSGKNKIVQLSEKSVEASALGYLDKLCIEEADSRRLRYMLAAPFSSVYGIMILCACLIKGFTIIIADGDFTLSAFFRAVEKHKITNYEGSASAVLLMERMIGRHNPYDISTLTDIGFGGSKVPGKIIRRLQNAYEGKSFYQGYGMTEASPLIAKHPRGLLTKTESVGNAIKGMEIAVDSDGSLIKTAYVRGEIAVKGPNLMLGYYKNEAETRQAMRNGYLYTGDIGYLDEEGYLYICGRKKNIIIVRGFKVFPEELEECIQDSMLAEDCRVYGEADEFGNETVCADIVPISPQVSEADIRLFCGIYLADFKQPKIINFCECISKNSSGKTARREEIF